MANIGHPQARNGKFVEDGMVTSGNDLIGITRFLQPGASTYTAADVIRNLLLGLDSRDGSSQDGSSQDGSSQDGSSQDESKSVALPPCVSVS